MQSKNSDLDSVLKELANNMEVLKSEEECTLAFYEKNMRYCISLENFIKENASPGKSHFFSGFEDLLNKRLTIEYRKFKLERILSSSMRGLGDFLLQAYRL